MNSVFNSLEEEHTYFRELLDRPGGPDVRKDLFYLSRLIDIQAQLDAANEKLDAVKIVMVGLRLSNPHLSPEGSKMATMIANELEQALKGHDDREVMG